MIKLKNCYIIGTFNEKMEELKGYDILIEGNIIKKIEKNIAVKDCEVIDCSNSLVIPGMFNLHHHFIQILTRNLKETQDAKLFDWLTTLYPVWAKIDEDAIYWSSICAMAELIKTGATTTVDHHYLYPDTIKGNVVGIQIEAARKIGMRFNPIRGFMDKGKSKGGLPPDNVVQDKDTIIKDILYSIEKYHNNEPLSMCKILVGPCSPFSVSDDLMKETLKIARKYKVKLHTHLAETMDEVLYCKKEYKRTPTEFMEDIGFLGEDVSLVHSIYLNEGDLRIIKKSKSNIIHCPTSNMRLGSGIARIKEMKDKKIKVGLGVDGSSSNDSSDMLGEVRNCLLLQRVRYGADAITAREALTFATRNGADILGYKMLGSIEEGKGADLVIINLDKLQYAGALSDPISAIVFTGYNHEVDYVIIDGKIVLEKGRLKNIDEDEILREIRKINLS